MKNTLLTPEELAPMTALKEKVLEELDAILLGRHELHTKVLIGILSRGHILLEGLPGLGKTALVHALGNILQLSFKRIQFTPDLMPGDILGSHILQTKENGMREMIFQPGPVFTQILLADEINRASPKTQSAMLETMQEQTVTLLGETRKLPAPFFVLASQNPIELEGTYPLPEAQLDRFLFKLTTDNIGTEVLEKIISTRHHGVPPTPQWQMSEAELHTLLSHVQRVVIPVPVARYIARIVTATHPGSDEATEYVNEYVTYGASPRAAIGIAEASRARALIEGRPTAGFDDVRSVADGVMNHRIIVNYKARLDSISTCEIIADAIKKLPVAEMDLPDEITISE